MPGSRARRRTAQLAVALLLTATGCTGSGGSGAGKRADDAAGGLTGPPIVLGMINQENAPIGSFPELREGAQAAVRYVNRDLRGVGGRPLRLEVCTTAGTPESSQACANRLLAKQPLAVLGGIDLGAAASLPILAGAGIPYVGGAPTLAEELTSPASYMLTGGTAADLLAEVSYITDTLQARKVAILHVDLPGVLDAAVSAARLILRAKGVRDVTVVSEKADAADFAPAVNAAAAGKPDATIVVFPAQGCSRVMQARQALGLGGATFYPSACASAGVVDAAGGGGEGAYFASGYLPSSSADTDVALYRAKLKQYAAKAATPSLLSQTGFSVVVDVHALLTEAGGGTVTSAGLTAALKATRDHPSFMSHPYSCDGKQVPLATAVCNPNVRILQYRGGRFEDVVGDWVSGVGLVKLLFG